MDFMESLRAYASSSGATDEHGLESEEQVALNFEKLIQAEDVKATEQLGVPRFFSPKPARGSLRYKLKAEARKHGLQLRGDLILKETELRQIWYILVEYATKHGDEIRINYDGFSQAATRCREEFGAHCDSYLKASAFMRFDRDADSTISVPLFWQYIKERAQNLQMRIHLTFFDEDGDGALSEEQLQEYIASVVPDIPALSKLQASFAYHYKRITARKFTFFYGKQGVVRIRDLVGSQALNEFLALKDPDIPESGLLSNWFSLQSAQRVYACFQGLDSDMSNSLSRDEFGQLGQGAMTKFFIQRVFEVHVMKQRGLRAGKAAEMDVMDFVEFVLAWDNRSHPACVPYFFRILDIHQRGYISHVELYLFYKEVHNIWLRQGEDPDLRIDDVVAELIDMIQPRDPLAITQKDFLRCHHTALHAGTGTVFGMLASKTLFQNHNDWEHYLNR